jgi:hypothetical protein
LGQTSASRIVFIKEGKESASFLKKRSKKLLLIWTVLVSWPGAQFAKVFCALFFKKALLSFYPAVSGNLAAA